jgi:hypothetical protein
MDAVTGTLLGTIIVTIGSIVVARITRPSWEQRGRQAEILANTRKTGNGWTERLDGRLDMFFTNQLLLGQQLDGVKDDVAVLTGRLDEHLRKGDDDNGQDPVAARRDPDAGA